MILILGGTGYVGNAFCEELTRRNVSFRNLSRSEHNYYDLDTLVSLIRDSKAEFLINAAGYTGKPNVDACEIHKWECLQGNAVLPGIIRDACELTELPWGHVSSGCIYTGSNSDGSGFTESDDPNFCFRTNNCSFYSGCKAIGEECLEGAENAFVWRLRIPFNHVDSGRNYLSKIMRYQRLLDATNSVSHLDEFVRCCLETWENRVPFGIYNVTNSGSVTTRRVTELIQSELSLNQEFDFFDSEEEFMKVAAKTPRSNCVMDNSKLLSTGIQIRHVEDAIKESLQTWITET
ncbi:MAG: sugar nucleotide-binding protein [Planctomycetota bacterium]